MTLSHVTALPLLAIALTALASTGCAASGTASQPRVVLVQDEEFVLTGTTDPSVRKTACTAGTPKHYIKLIEPLKAKITLRGTNGAAPLTGAVMSVTNVDSHATLCATMRDDGTPAVIPAELDIGTYAIAVSGDQPPRRYEILWEQR
jgi:hypothetical protein